MSTTRSDMTLTSGTQLSITLEIENGQCEIECRYSRCPLTEDQISAHKIVDILMEHLNMLPIKRWGALRPEVKATHA